MTNLVIENFLELSFSEFRNLPILWAPRNMFLYHISHYIFIMTMMLFRHGIDYTCHPYCGIWENPKTHWCHIPIPYTHIPIPNPKSHPISHIPNPKSQIPSHIPGRKLEVLILIG